MSKDISISDIEAHVVHETPEEFEPINSNGQPSGVILLVKSEQAPSVQEAILKSINDRRRTEQFQAAQAAKARAGNEPFTPVEDDLARNRRLTALRLAGWKGLKDEFNQENAVRLLTARPGWVQQIIDKSAEMTDFTPASSKSS